MWSKMCKTLLVILVGMFSTNCLGQLVDKKGKSPLDELPAYIKRVTHFGQRADFSHDGRRILFIEKTFGDVYEVEIATGVIRPVTHHYFHEGYTRALYLASGDILLSGARKFDSENPWPSRSEENAELWVLKKDLSRAPTPLGEKCSEGPAVSRRNMRIAWTQAGAFYMADIVYENGRARLAGRKKILDKNDLPFECGLETQNFRPPDEKELIFSAYGYQGTEVMGLDIATGRVVNYSSAPQQYDEPEGIFGDGKHTLVECDRHNRKGSQHIDIYKLALDGSGRYERITFFGDRPGYKSSNPVVSDDGRYIAFQVAKVDDPAGVGRGILIFDLQMYKIMNNPPAGIEKKIKQIEKAYGVRVHYQYDRKEFFPRSWLREPISAEGSQMPPEEIKRVLSLLDKFLCRYPKQVLKKNLTDIYLVKDLKFYDKSFGGSYADSSLYINSLGVSKGFTDSYLLGTMHSEFSSILLRNYGDRFRADAWKAANEPGFEYNGTGVEMLGRNDIFAQSHELADHGFLVSYSQSSLENDVNMYAFWAFTRAEELKSLASEYNRISRKYRLFAEFYNRISPQILRRM